MSVVSPERPVIVGVDASEAAVRAVQFAADEARRRSVPLQIVHAITWFDAMRHPYPELDLGGRLVTGAESLLQAMSDHVAGSIPDDRISTSAVEGSPVEVLVEASSRASLIVVGGRGVGKVVGMLLGSTVHGVVARAACPVVVLPDHSTVRARERQSVVVGVEGRGDEEVLAFAVGEAVARETDLLAVHAWQDVLLETSPRWSSPEGDRGAVAADELRLLAEALAGWREKEPDLGIREVVVREWPARALREASVTAQMLVVGHRRRRILGSTTYGTLHRAPCPVAVVPLPERLRR